MLPETAPLVQSEKREFLHKKGEPKLALGYCRRLLAHTLDGQIQINHRRSRAKVHRYVVVSQLDAGSPDKASAVAAPGILAFTNELRVDHHRPGHTVKGEVAGDPGGILASHFHTGGDKGCLRILVDVEEVRAAQVLVTLGVVGVDTRGVDGHFDLALFRLGGVPAEAAVEV